MLPGARTVARKNAESPINEKQSKGETDHFAGKLKFCASPVWRDRKGDIKIFLFALQSIGLVFQNKK
jgi:hypothetical protein